MASFGLSFMLHLIFRKRMKPITFKLFFNVKRAKHEKHRFLLTFHDLLTYQKTLP